MARQPYHWGQAWLPRAAKLGLRWVEGDFYAASAGAFKGVGAYYSERFGAWVWQQSWLDKPDAKRLFKLCDLGWTEGNTSSGLMTHKVVLEDRTAEIGQDALAAEFDRLNAAWGTRNGQKRSKEEWQGPFTVRSEDQVIRLVEEQQRTDGSLPPDPEIIELRQALDTLKDQVWAWYVQHIIEEFDVEPSDREQLDESLAELGILPPTEEMLVTIRVPRGTATEQIQASIGNLNIEVVEVSK